MKGVYYALFLGSLKPEKFQNATKNEAIVDAHGYVYLSTLTQSTMIERAMTLYPYFAGSFTIAHSVAMAISGPQGAE